MRVLCTAGHVDHGKSTLVAALTGTDPDRLAEEQRRGLTIELGFAWTELPGTGDVAFVDLPGHERFVPTMLAGAGPIGTALFVVAADEGWMPQSAEHLAILRLLDVRSGVVALTRTDLVDADTVDIAVELVREELDGSGLADAPIVPVSAVTGAGLDALRTALAGVLGQTPPPADGGRARLWIDRSFSISGAGTVVTGTLSGGSLSVGDELALWRQGSPSVHGEAVRVRGLQSLERRVDRAEPGWRVALNLVGVDVADVPRGSMLGQPGQWHPSAALDIWCTPDGGTLGRRGAWRVHIGTAELGAGLFPVGGTDLTAPGPVRLELERPLPLVAGDRLVIRDAGRGKTVGGGVVLDPEPGPRPRGRPQRAVAVDRLTVLASASTPAERLAALVADRGEMPADRARSLAGVGPSIGITHRADDEPVLDGAPIAVGALLMAPQRWAQLRALLVQAVGEVHRTRPALPVADRAHLRRVAEDTAPSTVTDAVTGELVRQGVLEAAPGGVRLPGHRPQMTDAQQRARQMLLQRLDEAGWEAPPLAELAADAGADPDLLAALLREGAIVPFDGATRALSRAGIQRATTVLATLDGPFTAAQARDALGTSRRWALPLLEALDQSGVTRRDGDLRTLA
ncbi:selenocysteine-specific translation elongation factor [soil metagenome]